MRVSPLAVSCLGFSPHFMVAVAALNSALWLLHSKMAGLPLEF